MQTGISSITYIKEFIFYILVAAEDKQNRAGVKKHIQLRQRSCKLMATDSLRENKKYESRSRR